MARAIQGAALLAMLPLVLLLLLQLAVAPLSAETPAAFAKRVIDDNRIVIFSKSYCPYCKRAKSVFAEMKEKPYVIELDQREDGADIQQAVADLVGRRTVPQVFIHGKHIGGSDDTVEAYHNGSLAELLDFF
ncbi:hypothetical protein L7F22_054127 [Adiantum nelumboides]|nr:hypothetical protein [Adiantum nelumboides]